jgi:hypothetical protein
MIRMEELRPYMMREDIEVQRLKIADILIEGDSWGPRGTIKEDGLAIQGQNRDQNVGIGQVDREVIKTIVAICMNECCIDELIDAEMNEMSNRLLCAWISEGSHIMEFGCTVSDLAQRFFEGTAQIKGEEELLSKYGR